MRLNLDEKAKTILIPEVNTYPNTNTVALLGDGDTSQLFLNSSILDILAYSGSVIMVSQLFKAEVDFVLKKLPGLLSDFQIQKRESSTSKRPVPELVERMLSDIFSSSSEEEFSYGYVSQLAVSLEDFIRRYAVDAIDAIQYYVYQKQIDVDLLVEALHTIGQLQDEITHERRLLLLRSALATSSARIRRAAALGLAYMDDPRAIPALKKALNVESQDSVKVWIEQTLKQLELTQIEI